MSMKSLSYDILFLPQTKACEVFFGYETGCGSLA